MSLALLLLSATQGALLTRTPLRPQLTCRRRSDAVALIGGIDPVEAIQHAHAAVATHLPVTTQLLSDADGLTDEARKAATGELGWWGTYIKFVEDGILGLRAFYESKGLSYPYGLAIFTFVLGVKLITLPLNWNQLSSAAEMKSIKPAQERVTTWYGDNDQIKNAAVGNLYDNLNINPLAGCLPALAQIPVFLGVYYSVTSIAKAAIIQEGFLWIPNLSGPISDRRDGLTWLTDGWVDGVPRLGWEDTLAYLTLPVILVCTQTLSLYLLGSFEAIDDGKESSKNAATALRLLPLMIGWFAMNAPSGLGLYWVFNNVLTTVSTVSVKKLVEKDELEPEPLVSLATLGPRREPLPIAECSAPDWVPQAPPQVEAAEVPEAAEA